MKAILDAIDHASDEMVLCVLIACFIAIRLLETFVVRPRRLRAAQLEARVDERIAIAGELSSRGRERAVATDTPTLYRALGMLDAARVILSPEDDA